MYHCCKRVAAFKSGRARRGRHSASHRVANITLALQVSLLVLTVVAAMVLMVLLVVMMVVFLMHMLVNWRMVDRFLLDVDAI